MKITRKRFIKVLMSSGFQKKEACLYARLVKVFGSYFELARAFCGLS